VVDEVTVGAAAARTGWSARMLRYLEQAGLVVPRRTLRSLRELRRQLGVEISDLAFAARLRREPSLRSAVDGWLAGRDDLAWVEWEQRKHERLLAA